MKRKLSSLLLAALLVLALVPAAAFAESAELSVTASVESDGIHVAWDLVPGSEFTEVTLLQLDGQESHPLQTVTVTKTSALMNAGLVCRRYYGTDDFAVQVVMYSSVDHVLAEGTSPVFHSGKETLQSPKVSLTNGGTVSVQTVPFATDYTCRIYSVTGGVPDKCLATWSWNGGLDSSQADMLVSGMEYAAAVTAVSSSNNYRESELSFSDIITFTKKGDAAIEGVPFFGSMTTRLDADTLGTLSSAVESFTTDWTFNEERITAKPFVIEDGVYTVTLTVNAAAGHCFTYETTLTALGKTASPQQLAGGGRTAIFTLEGLVINRTSALPVLVKNPASVQTVVGTPVFFTVEASGADSYKWYIAPAEGETPYAKEFIEDSASVSGEKTANLTLNPYDDQLNGARVYCIVSNGSGSVVSKAAVLQIAAKGATVPDAPAYEFPFTDVTESDWFFGDVKFAHQSGLVSGKTANTFAPNDKMTYAEAIKLAACMNQYYLDGEVTLEDSTSGNWYDSYVTYAKQHKIPADYSNYKAAVTREEYVHIFYAALPEKEYAAMNDIDAIWDVSGAYAGEILTFYRAGILAGNDEKGTFAPASSIRRSQVAAILTRMLDPKARLEFLPK